MHYPLLWAGFSADDIPMTSLTSTFTELPLLSETELAELDRFLASDATPDQAMMVDAIDGYLTALALGPAEVPTERWMPGIWGAGGAVGPRFQDAEQERHIIGLILRHRSGIAAVLDANPAGLNPIFDAVSYQDKAREYLDGEMWCYGFIQGISLARSAWQPLFEDQEAMEALLPIYVLGADGLTPEQRLLGNTPVKREALTRRIPASIDALWRFWHPGHRPTARPAPTVPLRHAEARVGRNDPCPCGSGRKWKKCCGAH